MRLAVVGIVVEDRERATDVQRVLTEYGEWIAGRMGVPDRESGISVISLIVKADVERISALTGKLGRIPGVSVKSAVTGKNVDGDRR